MSSAVCLWTIDNPNPQPKPASRLPRNRIITPQALTRRTAIGNTGKAGDQERVRDVKVRTAWSKYGLFSLLCIHQLVWGNIEFNSWHRTWPAPFRKSTLRKKTRCLGWTFSVPYKTHHYFKELNWKCLADNNDNWLECFLVLGIFFKCKLDFSAGWKNSTWFVVEAWFTSWLSKIFHGFDVIHDWRFES